MILNKNFRIAALFILFFSCCLLLSGQETTEASPFDFGRMWTFEEAPTDWFKEAYDMDADQAWFDNARKSSLKFASWCSASFVSSNGLIMTNHHCSRDVAISVQQGKENFDENGFYATDLKDERRVDDLFVEQLIMIADISKEILAAKSKIEGEEDDQKAENEALQAIKLEYEGKKGWENLRLETVSFYSGGRYSLYGYKKYSDIRLVLIPENELGFYGGDPDNFTFPRYNLDCTFWRAYDENGQPMNTSEHYYKFNIDGVEEGTPVFVVGNPGRTERYRTTSQLEYDRDFRYKHLLKWLGNRIDLLQEEYTILSKDLAMVRDAQDLLSTINNLSNSLKAYNGIMGGLKDSRLMNRKSAMETAIISNSDGKTYWSDLDNEYKKLEPHAWASDLLRPSIYKGKALSLMHETARLRSLLENEESDKDEITESKKEVLRLNSGIDIDKEKRLLSVLLEEVKELVYPGDNTLNRLLDGKTITAYVDNLFAKSNFLSSEQETVNFLDKDRKIKKGKDVMLNSADILITRYDEAMTAFTDSNPYRKSLEGKIANQAFKKFGPSLPPDATFTLRISDGIVKNYEYNGTVSPIMTTYFGMYDRHYSNDQTFPWSLPKKWSNPPFELLKSPLNFVSTNDIIGGNSGSAIINQKGEAVGLIFDGNIESLPGNFIFDEKYNRSVSVHAGGIYAAMKYIYKADRLLSELVPDK